jgi:hypothetical protein
MLDFSLDVVGDVDIIPRSLDVLFCCACCSVAVLNSVIPGGNWNFSESSFVYYANTCVFVSAYTISDTLHI